MTEAFHAAIGTTLPVLPLAPHKPWISAQTLDLIQQRTLARRQGHDASERHLNAKVKQSVKTDRGNWLDGLLATGAWEEVRRLRKGFKPRQGRVRNLEGNLVDSEARANTLAEHYSEVQWARRDTTPMSAEVIGPSLPVRADSITDEEVVAAAKKMKWGKARGPDGVPGDLWKAICMRGSPARSWALALCQKCWEDGAVPDAWHEFLVTAIFKKGDPSKCENYRPICLLQAGYKLYATILLQRLKAAGAEDRVWDTQFGFKSKHGTADAIFLARRRLDEIWATKEGQLVLLALDWEKAFDSVDPDSLIQALRRFGLPTRMLAAINGIYKGRRFAVRDAGQVSVPREQQAGICQGCPLSPFLFAMVMTVLLRDARTSLGAPGDKVGELVYADDTFILATGAEQATEYMQALERAGANYGLKYN